MVRGQVNVIEANAVWPARLGGVDADEEREARARNGAMVDRLVARGVLRDPAVEAAFRLVLRHRFLSGVPLAEVYSGQVVPTHWHGQRLLSSSSEPAIMAKMLEQLRVQAGDRVLEIGTGTGYNAALLAELVGSTGAVTTVDIDDTITREARHNLDAAGFGSVDVVTGDGWERVTDDAPFDSVEVTASVWDLSPAWVDQTRVGGTVVAPLWLYGGLQASVAFRKDGRSLRSRSVEPCGFIPLRGSGAGPSVTPRERHWTGPPWSSLQVAAFPPDRYPASTDAVAVLHRANFTYVVSSGR